MNKGITLITLIITFIVLMILAGTATIIGSDMVEKTKQQDLNRQLTMVNNAILEQYTKYIKTKDTSYLIGTKYQKADNYMQEIISKIGVELIQIPNSYAEDLKSYYQLSVSQLNQIGVQDSKYTYIVNYLTGEVINETKALAGEKYYMYSRSHFDGNITDIEELIVDAIRISTTPSTWTNENVTVYLNYAGEIPSGYVIQYKKGNENWTTGNTLTVETNNTTVYGRLYKSASNDEMGINSKTIANIDKVNPTAPTGITSSATSNSITVTATGGTDSSSGVIGYQYSLDNISWSGRISKGTGFIFRDLSAATSYTIYAKTIDKAGNVSNNAYSTIEETTQIASSITETSIIYGQEKERTVSIPAGYVLSSMSDENTIAGGLVIYEGTEAVTSENHATALTERNQYVWIPVDDINSMIMCKVHGATVTLDVNTLQCPTCGVNTILAGKLFATTTGENFNINLTNQVYISSALKEPATVSDDPAYLPLTLGAILEQFQNDFNSMAKSVAKYKGFYVSRYEIGTNGASKKNQTVLDASTGGMWYGLYNVLRKQNQKIINSSMIWGCQYDQILKFMNGKADGSGATVNVNTPSSSRQLSSRQVSGYNVVDKICNIYDLEGNCYEWTLETYDTSGRILRGSNSYNAGIYSLSFRYAFPSNGAYDSTSSRATLYIAE